MAEEEAREKFRSKLNAIYARRPNNNLLSEAEYRTRLQRLTQLQDPDVQRTPADAKLLKNCCIINERIDNVCTSKLGKSGTQLQYVTMEELFDVLHDIHTKLLNHSGRNCMLRHIRTQYCNISKDVVMLYLSTCRNCPRQKRMNGVTRRNVVFDEEPDDELDEDLMETTIMEAVDVKTGITNGHSAVANTFHVTPLNINFDQKPMGKIEEGFSRGQIDLFQMHENPDGNFNYFLRYVNLTTKRVRLRPLTNGTVSEIANVLFDIYCEQGAPCVLQSLHGRELTQKIIAEINTIFPCRQLHGEVRGSVESAQIILNQLTDLMKRFNSSHWSSLLRILEYEINTTYRDDIQTTPFELTFGQAATMGLRSSKLMDTIYEKSQSEEEILEYLADAELIRCSIFCQTPNEPKRASVRHFYDEPLALGCSSSRFSSPISNNGLPTAASLSQLGCTPDSLSQSASSSNTSFYNPGTQSTTPNVSANGQQQYVHQPITPQSQASNSEHFVSTPFDTSPAHLLPAFFPSVVTTSAQLNGLVHNNLIKEKNELLSTQINDCLVGH